MPYQQVKFEPMQLWQPFQYNIIQTGGLGLFMPNNIFWVVTGSGSGLIEITNGVMIVSILTNGGNRLSEVKFATSFDADTNKIRVKPNTQYTMRCTIGCSVASGSPTGATIKLIEINAAGVQIASVNSPAVSINTVTQPTETVLNFTTGALTRYLDPVFTVNGGAAGIITASFQDFQLYETL